MPERMALTVRRACDDDKAFIESLGLATALETVSSLREMTESAARQAFRRLLTFCRERAGTVTFVAEDEGRPVGFVILLTDLPDDVTQTPQAFIAYIAVVKEHRGRGVGRALLRTVAEESRRHNLPHIALMVSADNPRARRLYESEGFVAERVLMTRRVPAAGTSRT
jgi:ribosomal protein S18 acetylase RimI-like enzyme